MYSGGETTLYILTLVIPSDEIGTWIIDTKSKGTADDPKRMPFVHYTEMAQKTR